MALRVFTAEFGMGSGVSPSLKPPGRAGIRAEFCGAKSPGFCEAECHDATAVLLHRESGTAAPLSVPSDRELITENLPFECLHAELVLVAASNGLEIKR